MVTIFFKELIDKVLEEDDLDDDGYLGYTEYVLGRQRAHIAQTKRNQARTNQQQIVGKWKLKLHTVHIHNYLSFPKSVAFVMSFFYWNVLSLRSWKEVPQNGIATKVVSDSFCLFFVYNLLVTQSDYLLPFRPVTKLRMGQRWPCFTVTNWMRIPFVRLLSSSL